MTNQSSSTTEILSIKVTRFVHYLRMSAKTTDITAVVRYRNSVIGEYEETYSNWTHGHTPQDKALDLLAWQWHHPRTYWRVMLPWGCLVCEETFSWRVEGFILHDIGAYCAACAKKELGNE